MNIFKISIFIFLVGAFKCSFAQTYLEVQLYPNGIPNSKATPTSYNEYQEKGYLKKVSEPMLLCYFPKEVKENRTAVIICPGGAYASLAIGYEGTEVAKKLNEFGIVAFVLKYRLPDDEIMLTKDIGPLQDAQRAVQLIRQNVKSWGILPNKVGVMGFSSGGHLASSLGVHYSKSYIENPESVNLRPDFLMLIYPVITFIKGTQQRLLGSNPTEEQMNFHSNEKHVDAGTPPTFLLHCADDPAVASNHSVLFYQALRDASVKTELHIFQNGGHGFGLNNKFITNWIDLCHKWLKNNDMLSD